MTIFTIGHSDRPAEEFISLLKEFSIQALADIRRFPSSRKHPHFNSEPLRSLLRDNQIEYVWLEALGGRRKGAGAISPNLLLRSRGFRNYADYMATEEFTGAVETLIELAGRKTTAIMCAEKLYWKCHRMLLSDYLVANDVDVSHIVEHGKTRRHELLAGAIVTPEKTVIYPKGRPG